MHATIAAYARPDPEESIVRTARTAAGGTAPPPRAAALIRNVAVVGPSGAGKTTLVEALLLRAGAIARAGRARDGATAPDSDDGERPPHRAVSDSVSRSVYLSVTSLAHGAVTLNLLDTPGSPDFVGGLRAGLRAADGALFVMSADGGLDAVTGQLWQECAAGGLPRAVVVTQLDRPRADFDEAVALCQRVLDDSVLPLHLPMHDDDGAVAGLIRLLDHRVVDHSTGERVERPAEPEHVQLVAALRAELTEAIISQSEDESLLDSYLAGGQLDLTALTAELETAAAGGHFHPVLAAAPGCGVGLDELLDLLAQGFPSPLEHPCPAVTRPDGSPAVPLSCDPAGPLAAEVVRTTTDPDLGPVSYVRVLSGTLRPDTAVHVCGRRAGRSRQRPDLREADERTGPLASPLGAALRPVTACPAGDLCTVAGLSSAATGDTLSDRTEPLLVAPWVLPEPQLPVAVEAASRADAQRLGAALARLVAEDPTARLERVAETGQQLLWCIGPAHAEVLLERLRSRHGLVLLTPDVQVALREESTAAGTLLREPWWTVTVQLPTAFVGSVLSDLARRRGRVTGNERDAEDDDHSVVRAELPERELLTYAAALRVVSHGTGSFTRRPLGHEPVPPW